MTNFHRKIPLAKGPNEIFLFAVYTSPCTLLFTWQIPSLPLPANLNWNGTPLATVPELSGLVLVPFHLDFPYSSKTWWIIPREIEIYLSTPQ